MASQNKAVRGAYENVPDGTLYTPDSLLTFEPGVNIRDSTASLLDHPKMEGTVAKYLCDDYEATYLINGTVKFPTSTSLAHKSVQKIECEVHGVSKMVNDPGQRFDHAVIFREPTKDGFGPQPSAFSSAFSTCAHAYA